MPAGGYHVYDRNDYFRVIEDDNGVFYIQRKPLFFWKFYRKNRIKLTFNSYADAKATLEFMIDQEKIKRVKHKKVSYKVHKI